MAISINAREENLFRFLEKHFLEGGKRGCLGNKLSFSRHPGFSFCSFSLSCLMVQNFFVSSYLLRDPTFPFKTSLLHWHLLLGARNRMGKPGWVEWIRRRSYLFSTFLTFLHATCPLQKSSARCVAKRQEMENTEFGKKAFVFQNISTILLAWILHQINCWHLSLYG